MAPGIGGPGSGQGHRLTELNLGEYVCLKAGIPCPTVSPKAGESHENPLPLKCWDQSTVLLGYGLQSVGWQWGPEQASHWEAFPVYDWLPLG